MARYTERPSQDAIQRLFELTVDMLGTSVGRLLHGAEPGLGALARLDPRGADGGAVHLLRPSRTTSRRRAERSAVFADPDGDAVVTFENRYRTRDGDYRFLHWTTVAVDGVLYFAAKDVTDRKVDAAASQEAEQLIRNSEALHRTLTGNLPDTTVFLLDHDLRILIADGEAIRRLGFLDADMFRGRRVAELYAEVPDEVLQLCLENYSAALQGERRAFEFVSDGTDVRRPGGARPRRRRDRSSPLLVVARDVSERTRAEEQLARRARQQNAVADARALRAREPRPDASS